MSQASSLTLKSHTLSGRPDRSHAGHDEQLVKLLCWSSLFVLVAVVFGRFLLVGRGSMLNMLFPILTLAIGVQLYYLQPQLYLGYCWWLWFLTPEIRRMADLQGGYTAINPLMLAPLLVSGLTLITAIRRSPMLGSKSLVGFVPVILAMAYGTVVGVVTTGAGRRRVFAPRLGGAHHTGDLRRVSPGELR